MCRVLQECCCVCFSVRKTDSAKSSSIFERGEYGKPDSGYKEHLVITLCTLPIRLPNTLPISSTLIGSSCLRGNCTTTSMTYSLKKNSAGAKSSGHLVAYCAVFWQSLKKTSYCAFSYLGQCK